MGECMYYLKAKFPKGKLDEALKKVGAFQKESIKAAKFFHKRPFGESEKYWATFEKSFPLISDYLKSSGLFGTDKNDLAGKIDFGDEEDAVYIDDDTLCFSAYIWHLAEWKPFTDYLVKAYGATRAIYGSEDDGCGSIDSLQFYNYKDIVDALLEHKDTLLLLLHINPELDELINEKLRE